MTHQNKTKPKHCKACGNKIEDKSGYCEVCHCRGNEAYIK